MKGSPEGGGEESCNILHYLCMLVLIQEYEYTIFFHHPFYFEFHVNDIKNREMLCSFLAGNRMAESIYL